MSSSSEKISRSHKIEVFFNKKKKVDEQELVTSSSLEDTHSTHQRINHSINSNISSTNSQIIRPINSNVSIDTSVILSCLDNIITNIENDGGDELSSTKSSSNETNILFDIGVDLRRVQQMSETCVELINQTTEIDNVQEKVLNDTLDFTNRLILLVNNLRDKCVINDNSEKPPIDRDPGAAIGLSNNIHKFSDDQLRYLTSKGPFQPRIDFPINEKLKSAKQTYKFVHSWYADFPFLEYSIAKDKVYCFVCRLFGDGAGSEQSELAWIIGTNRWNKMKSRGKEKKGKLVLHFTSKSHNAALDRYNNFITNKNHVGLMLDSHKQQAEQKREATLKYNCTIVSTLIDISRFLARQNLAFRGRSGGEEQGNYVQLVNLFRRYNSNFNQWFLDTSLRAHQVTYLTPQAQNEFIEIIGKEVHSEVLKRIMEVPFISIMVDSTPDISNKEMYSIIIRYTRNFEIQERLFAFGELNSKVGEHIVEFILSFFKTFGISTTKIIAQSYDGASNMTGKNIGVQTLLSKKLNRNIIFIPCGAHRSNLVIKHSSSISVEYISLFNLLQALYNYIGGSVKRHMIYKTKIDETNYGLLLKDLCETRWYARYESLNAVYISFHQLVECLSELEDDTDTNTRHKAKALRKKIVSFEFYVLLIFLRKLMAMTNATTIQLQQQELNIIAAIEMLSSLLELLKELRNDDDAFEQIIGTAENELERYDVDFEAEFHRLHRSRLRSSRIDDNNANAHVFTRTLNETVCWFKHLSPSTINGFNQNDADHLLNIVPGIDDALLLFQEFKQLTPTIMKCSSTLEVAKIFKDYYKIYPRAALVYQFMLTLPITVATNERTFSKLKLIKNYLRSTMDNQRLFYLLISSIEYDILDEIDPQKLVQDWAKIKDRKIVVY
ncbi:unnamed protein product [Rotaria sp. Silwood2]|nr:unnamed protein product [Rotaria sp. Silwood2]CAF4378318.1 unnamed protein product [Rotaria sp. Silwood2]